MNRGPRTVNIRVFNRLATRRILEFLTRNRDDTPQLADGHSTSTETTTHRTSKNRHTLTRPRRLEVQPFPCGWECPSTPAWHDQPVYARTNPSTNTQTHRCNHCDQHVYDRTNTTAGLRSDFFNRDARRFHDYYFGLVLPVPSSRRGGSCASFFFLPLLVPLLSLGPPRSSFGALVPLLELRRAVVGDRCCIWLVQDLHRCHRTRIWMYCIYQITLPPPDAQLLAHRPRNTHLVQARSLSEVRPLVALPTLPAQQHANT